MIDLEALFWAGLSAANPKRSAPMPRRTAPADIEHVTSELARPSKRRARRLLGKSALAAARHAV